MNFHASQAWPGAGADPVPTEIARLDAKAERLTVAVGGGSVTWRCFGQGPTLVLLHGGHGSWLHWLRNIEALARTHRVCVPDMPGYGESKTPVEPTLDALLRDLQTSLDLLVGPDTLISLAGFSFGGLVAAHLAARRGRTRRLALMGTAGHGSPRRERTQLLNWRLPLARHDTEVLRAVMHHNLLGLMLHDEANIDEIAMHIHTVSCLCTRFHSRTLSQTADLREALDRVTVPTLLLWGEHDVTATPQGLSNHLTVGWPHRRLEVIPAAGHWVSHEACDTVNVRLERFMSAAEAC